MRRIILTIWVMLAGVCLVKADLVFDSGYNTFDANDPYYDEVAVFNNAHLDVLGGEMGKLEFRNYSTGHIYDGQMNWLWTDDNTVINIYGGSLNVLASRPDSTVYLHAYDVVYHPAGGLGNPAWLEGIYYSKNSPFSFIFDGLDDSCYEQVTIVPEPITLVFLGLGYLILRRKK